MCAFEEEINYEGDKSIEKSAASHCSFLLFRNKVIWA